VNVHFGLGYLLWKQHHFDEAAKEFQAELENDPPSSGRRAPTWAIRWSS
jgi:hypothetical protein